MKNKVLVIGLGNEWLHDDGIGVKVVKDMERQSFSSEVDFKSLQYGGLELLDHLNDYESVLFIDAIKEEGRETAIGTLFDINSFKETLHLSHIHDLDFITTIKFGNLLGMEIPKNIFVYSIQIEENKIFSKKLSPLIEQGYENLLLDIRDIIIALESDVYDFQSLFEKYG